MNDEQLQLFPDRTPQPVDTDAAARHIGEFATPVVFEDRTSEAAQDQGWGAPELFDDQIDAEAEEPGASSGVPPDIQKRLRAYRAGGATRTQEPASLLRYVKTTGQQL